jgi:hypothetical protein
LHCRVTHSTSGARVDFTFIYFDVHPQTPLLALWFKGKSRKLNMSTVKLSRGQIVEAIQNVLLDYESTEQNWIDNKQKVLDAITKGVEESGDGNSDDHPITQLKNQRLMQKKEREKQWEGILEHWKGVEDDFADVDQKFLLLQTVLSQNRNYWKDTTCKTTEDLISRNDEIMEQGKKMEKIEERANKVKVTQDKMNRMMNSKSQWMGRIICPILMCLCCCYLFASLTLTVVLKVGVKQGLWNITDNSTFLTDYAKEKANDIWNPTNVPSPSIHINCTATVHLKCVNDCDVHNNGDNYKKCVQDCDLGC